jgi:hypothetical protein
LTPKLKFVKLHLQSVDWSCDPGAEGKNVLRFSLKPFKLRNQCHLEKEGADGKSKAVMF